MRLQSPLSFLALSCVLAPTASAQTQLTVQRLNGSVQRPLDVQSAPGDVDRIFVVSHLGTIHVFKGGTLLATPFLDVTSLVTQIFSTSDERGLLGMTFHPDYANNGFFFINYTARSGGASTVARYKVSANPDIADPNSARIVLTQPQPYGNHNGGCLAFGRDGYLYIGFGDGGSRNDPGCRAQSGSTLLGKMLRIDPKLDNTGGYNVPLSNPFRGNSSVLDEIWALGLRNPWRYSFDRLNGDLYIADVGQGALEEVSYQPGTSKGGENYGWKFMEGTNCFGTSSCSSVIPCNDNRLTDPIHVYGRTDGRSITGGYVYRGCAIPDLRGTYFFGDYATSRIWSFRYDGNNKTDFKDRTTELGFRKVSSFGQDARGELYICDHTGNSVYKIVPNAAPPVQDLGFGKVGGNGRIPRFDACGLLTSGNSAEFTLARAPSNAVAILTVSSQRNPTNLFGGTLVPVPPQLLINFVTDGSGRVRFTVPGGGGPATLFAQYVLLDQSASFGFGFSNALQVDFR